jgi:hypothetical protein
MVEFTVAAGNCQLRSCKTCKCWAGVSKKQRIFADAAKQELAAQACGWTGKRQHLAP